MTLTESENVRIATDDKGNSRLELVTAELKDAGWYQCSARNSRGATAVVRARVIVDKSKETLLAEEVARQRELDNYRLNLPVPKTVISKGYAFYL